MTQRNFGTSLGFSSGLVGQLEADLDPPSRRFLERISERYGISADWLLHGVGERFHGRAPGFAGRHDARIDPPELGVPYGGDYSYQDEEFAMIRRMELSVSAGHGLIPVEGGEQDTMAFSRSWLLRNGINADFAALVRVKGDSMAPTIADGSMIMIHVIENAVLREGIYAFLRDGATYIKRLIPVTFAQDGRATALIVLSDNPAYPPESLNGPQLNDLRIVGRVRCAMVTF